MSTFLILLACLHARPVGVHRTCRQANGIELTATRDLLNARIRLVNGGRYVADPRVEPAPPAGSLDIVVEVTSPGLTLDTITIPVSIDPRDDVLATAAASVGAAVV